MILEAKFNKSSHCIREKAESLEGGKYLNEQDNCVFVSFKYDFV